MAKPNYAFEKRQKELAKKKKKQEKLEQRKSAGSPEAGPETQAEVSLDDAAAETVSAPTTD
jgi:hypothetical protein